MRNLRLAAQQIANHAFAIYGVSDSLSNPRVAERRLAAVKSQHVQIRAGELKHLKFWILTEQVNGVRREAGGQRRDVNAPGAKLSLKRIGVGNHSDAHRRDVWCSIPIIRIR